MAKLKYKTQAVSTAIDPAGGYFCRVINADPVEDDKVFQEVIDALRLTESVFGLKKAMEAVIDTAMRKTAADGVPRKVGGLFRTYVTVKGKVPNADSPFAELTGENAGAYVHWGLSREVKREVDYNAVAISNVRDGQSAVVSSIAYNGAAANAFEIRRGTPILATGRNLVYIDGDRVAVSRMVDGAEVVLAEIVPDENDYYHQSFAWPAALDGVPTGGELKFTFRLRGGDADASPITVVKTVRVGEGGEEPAGDDPHIDEVQSTEVGATSGVIKVGEYPQLIGSNQKLGDGDKVHLYRVAPEEGAEETEVATILASGLRQNTDRVLTLDSKDLDLQASARYGFVIEKTITLADGKTATVRSNEAYATAVA